ncbi:MAG: ribose-5-phosphate isomerase RpiA [Caldicoprobacterales bacterium]
MKSVSSNVELKKMVGQRAADLVKDGMRIGIGTGSTVVFFIEELARRVQNGLRIQGAPTSLGTRLLCAQHGIPLLDSMTINHLDLAIDGADEIDPSLNAIKGGGGAHTVEKIIASMADEFVLIADQTKLVSSLCRKFPLPVEVIPASLSFAEKEIRRLGGMPALRNAVRKDGPVITENGNFILDITFSDPPGDLEVLNAQLKRIPGLLETGLFAGIAKKALIGYQDTVETLLPRES